MHFEDKRKLLRESSKVLEWKMRKKAIPKDLVRPVMSLHEESETRVRVDSDLSEEFEVKVGMHQGSVLSPFLFAVVVDVVIEFDRKSALSELLYADDLDLMSEKIKVHRNNLLKWKEVFESNGLKVNLGFPRLTFKPLLSKTSFHFNKLFLCTLIFSVATSQRVACLNVKLIHMGFPA